MGEVHLKSEEEKVKSSIFKSLNEWGVNNDQSEHREFRKHVVKLCLEIFRQEWNSEEDIAELKEEMEALRKESLPYGFDEAYKHVLYSDLVDDGTRKFDVCIDLLDSISGERFEGFCEPFFYKSDENGNTKLLKKRQFYRFHEMDPLRRYREEFKEPSDFFFERFFSPEEHESRLGVVFEAWIACHVAQFQSCVNCGCKKSVRWVGGFRSSWRDMECVHCHAVYEIKTKKSEKIILKIVHWGKIRGGSYRGFCKLKRRFKDQKVFLVLAPRASISSIGSRVYPVRIVEITQCSPKVSEWTLLGRPRLKTEVFFKSTKVKTWFELPLLEKTESELARIRMDVYHSTYSKKSYDFYAQKYGYGYSYDLSEDSFTIEENCSSGSGKLEENIQDSSQIRDEEEVMSESPQEVPSTWDDSDEEVVDMLDRQLDARFKKLSLKERKGGITSKR